MLLDPRTANLAVHVEAEVLEAFMDGQVNNQAKLVIQILDHFISKGLGLHIIFNRDDDVPQEFGLI